MVFGKYPFRAEPEVFWPKFATALRAGLVAAALVFAFVYFIFNKPLIAVLAALAFGLAFASMRYSAVKGCYRSLLENPPQFAGENVIIEGFAIHHRYIEGNRQAYMCLTEKRVHLSYYPFSDDDPGESFFLKNVKHIGTYNHWLLWPCGICLTTMDDKKHKIRVQARWRDAWLEELYDAWKAVVPVSPSKIQLQPLPIRTAPSEVVYTAAATFDGNGFMQVRTHSDMPEGEALVEMHVYNFRETVHEPVYDPTGRLKKAEEERRATARAAAEKEGK